MSIIQVDFKKQGASYDVKARCHRFAQNAIAAENSRSSHYMAFYFRKSIGFGPFRLNLSKSGIGASFGVRGARISAGPRGTYISVGRNGFYYGQRIDSPSSRRSSPSGGAEPLTRSTRSHCRLFSARQRPLLIRIGFFRWRWRLGPSSTCLPPPREYTLAIDSQMICLTDNFKF